MTEYVFCYDISDAKRLRKATKILQGQALRIQRACIYWWEHPRPCAVVGNN
ncbi:MAG: CRISPR-associated endonuclease Cas2 [Moraxellaceae bacterium]|nr:CRISPR-associated endonuclease Cas2 [Moraxellaceae bacterium]